MILYPYVLLRISSKITDFIESYRQQILKTPISPDSFQRQIQAAMGFNTGMRLRKINVPTLILHGKEDKVVPPENAEVLAKRIPNAKMIMIENAAHYVFYPGPKTIVNKITEFLTEKIEIEAQ